MTATDEMKNDGFGCDAFGHLTGPHVDGELSAEERDRYLTHLSACPPCQKLTSEYRALDVIARRPVPSVSGETWSAAWSGIETAIAADRVAAGTGPLVPFTRVIRASRGAAHRRPWAMPLAAALAVAALVAISWGMGQRLAPGDPDPGGVASGRQLAPLSETGLPAATNTDVVLVASARPPDRIRALDCQAGYVPVVYTVDGENPMTVVQCALAL